VKADPNRVDRAVQICKADLLTSMVGEFPELQGIMGAHYARLAGEGDDVATAIREHYLPRGASDEPPATLVGAVVAVADRIDSIAGCFGVGLVPTGSGDPFALRRAALGVVAIVQQRGWSVPLSALVARAIDAASVKITRDPADVRADVLEFFRSRLHFLYTGQGYASEVVTAVLAAGFDDLRDLEGRLQAVAGLHKRSDFATLAISFKRVANILEDGAGGAVDPSLFEDPQEGALHRAFSEIEARIAERVTARDYAGALRDLAELKGPIDAFFEKVLVNCPEPDQRANRKALLAAIAGTFRGIADFRRFAV
jgi:glycyl-tRNA synthetase beta chain